MRVMIVTPHLSPGGTERQIINLAKGLIQRNCKVVLLLTDRKGDLISELPNEVDIVFNPKGHPNFPSRTLAIYKAAKAKRPDVLYSRLWTTKGATTVVGKLLRIKTVLAEVSNAKESINRHPLTVRNAVRLAKTLCYRTADCVVSQTSSGKREIAKYLGIHNASIIYNSIDIDRIVEKSKKRVTHPWFNDNIPVAVAVGRLVPSKGFPNLIEAFAIVNRTVKARLLIIGGREREGIKLRLLTQLDRLKLNNSVSLVGEKPNPYPFMKAADLYVCSSLYEGFSNSLLEAMALGLPIVSTDYRHGASEIIEDGKSGILVPIADPETMARAIVRILKDGELRKRLSQNARKRARSFSLQKTASEYEKLFRTLQAKSKCL